MTLQAWAKSAKPRKNWIRTPVASARLISIKCSQTASKFSCSSLSSTCGAARNADPHPTLAATSPLLQLLCLNLPRLGNSAGTVSTRATSSTSNKERSLRTKVFIKRATHMQTTGALTSSTARFSCCPTKWCSRDRLRISTPLINRTCHPKTRWQGLFLSSLREIRPAWPFPSSESGSSSKSIRSSWTSSRIWAIMTSLQIRWQDALISSPAPLAFTPLNFQGFPGRRSSCELEQHATRAPQIASQPYILPIMLGRRAMRHRT